MDVEHSRALLTAANATDLDQRTLKERQERSLTTVRLTPELTGAWLTARVLLMTLRRLPGKLALDRTGLPEHLISELVDAVASIDSTRPLAVIDGPTTDASVQLDIGLIGERGFIRILPDGYGAQVANDPGVELSVGQPANSLGCVFAAACGAAETFKRLVVTKLDRKTEHPHMSFCPVTLAADTAAAPPLPPLEPLDVALVGNGAIGTAIGLILAELRMGGRVIVCDPENYGAENRGTYSLGGEREAKAQPLKVDVVGDVLEASGYTSIRLPEKSDEMIGRIDRGEFRPPRMVLTGLDNVEARRQTQLLWADHVLDGGTGDTNVGFVDARPEGPCLRCFFPDAMTGHDPLARLADMTGLPLSRLTRGDEALSEDDIASLTAEQQKLLRRYLGRPVCGLTDAFGLTDIETDGYLPSVPFVSQMAACLVVGRLLALRLSANTETNFCQFDALHGPRFADPEARRPSPECICQTRPAVVQGVRRSRWSTPTAIRV
jgi:hypothetical protein